MADHTCTSTGFSLVRGDRCPSCFALINVFAHSHEWVYDPVADVDHCTCGAMRPTPWR